MVTHLEQRVWAKRKAASAEAVVDHLSLAGGFGIAFEQGGRLAEDKTHDKRVIVIGRAGIGVSGLGRKYRDVERVPGEPVAGVQVADANA